MNFFKPFVPLLFWSVCAAVHGATLSESMNQRNGINDGFYSRHAEGWFWYQDPEPEETPETVASPIPAAVPDSTPKGDYLEPFTLPWLKKNLEKYLEIAWNDPSPENVQAYFLLQRFAVDRAQKFSDVAQQVVIGNKLLDETMRRPLANFGTKLADSAIVKEINGLLRKISEHAGIFFFFKSDCTYCEAQAPILKYVEDLGFHVMAVSVDGGQLKSAQFDDTRRDSGQAQALGVTATPTIFLMTDKMEFEMLAAGAVSFQDLRNRIFIGALRRGIITEDDLKRTKPLFDPDHQPDTSEMLPELLKTSVENPAKLFANDKTSAKLASLEGKMLGSIVESDGFIKPQDLLALAGDKIKTSKTIDELETIVRDKKQTDDPPLSIRFIQ